MRTEEEGGFVGRMDSVTNQEAPRTAILSPSEQRQMTSYVANVTRLRRRLDWRIARLATHSDSSMHPILRQILRLGEQSSEPPSSSPLPFRQGSPSLRFANVQSTLCMRTCLNQDKTYNPAAVKMHGSLELVGVNQTARACMSMSAATAVCWCQ